MIVVKKAEKKGVDDIFSARLHAYTSSTLESDTIIFVVGVLWPT